MVLNKLVVHEIAKASGVNESELRLSDELIENNDTAIELVSALHDSYNSDKVFYAKFDQSPGKYFPEKFNDYNLSSKNSNLFLGFTKSVVGNLNGLIKQVTLATGGYFVFAEYTTTKNFLGVFLIRDAEGKTLSRTNNSFTIDSVDYVDTEHLAMACRIDINGYAANQANYISLTQLRQKDISEYFKTWISIEQIESSLKYTKQFYDLVSVIERPIDPETDAEYELDLFRNLVYSYASSKPNKIINLRELGEHFYQDPNKVTQFALENEISIDTEFRYNTRQLKRLVKLEINKDGMGFRISRGTFEEKVSFPTSNSSLVVIESATFAEALRQERDAVDN
jgi:nucleoid-associated protein